MLNAPVKRRPSYWLWVLTFLFTGLSLTQLALVDRTLSLTTFIPLLVLMTCGGGVIYLLNLHFNAMPDDPVLLPLTFFLCGLGLVLIRRLAPAFINRQLFWLVIATGLLLAMVLIPKNLNWLRRYKYTWLFGGILLLASTLLFGVNPSGFGARLWLQAGPVFFQPSELLKLLFLVFLAAYLADRRRQLVEVRAYIGRLSMPHPNYLGPMLVMWGFSMVLLIWQRDLGAALLFFGTFLGMLYASTGQSSYIWGGVLLLGLGGLVGYELFGVVRIRVDGFLNPWLDASGSSFQIVQSLLAFASGGFFGEGIGQGLPTAIPVVHTDFVYAAIGEEFGLLGALGVLVCFMLLIGRAFAIAFRAKNDFEQLLAVGIGTMLALQTIVITAGTLKLMPLTGVTLPFVSYGGSSLIVSFTMIGLLLFMVRHDRVAGNGSGDGRVSLYSRRPYQPPVFYLSLAKILFVGLIVVAGGLILWQIAAPPFLEERDDNPRQVVAEQRIERGRLLTRDGIPIAETIIDEDDVARRHYPYPGLSSVTGYYSIRYGVGGVEATFDSILRGEVDQTDEQQVVDDLLHRPLVGRDVTLTIDLPAQVAADVALDDQEGAVVIMEIETGAVLVMSSHPTYDPNTLDETWDTLRQDARAPLVNRATQGLFPVGDVSRLIGLIGLYDSGVTRPLNPMTDPLEAMLAPLGPTGYATTARQLGLIDPLPGLASQPGRLPDFSDKGTVKDLAVTPLHMARVVAALELDGQLPTPMLALDAEPEFIPSFRPSTADLTRPWLSQVDEGLIGFSGQASPEETGQQSLSWFIGLAPTTVTEPIIEPTSVALTESGLIFDPTQIEQVTPTPIVETQVDRAKYVVVAVVVTETPEANPALSIARASLGALME